MTITDIKQLIKIVVDATKSGYPPELLINGEYYPIQIKGIIKDGKIIKYREKKG